MINGYFKFPRIWSGAVCSFVGGNSNFLILVCNIVECILDVACVFVCRLCCAFCGFRLSITFVRYELVCRLKYVDRLY